METEKWDLSSGHLSRSPRAAKRGALWKGVPGSYLVGLLVAVSYGWQDAYSRWMVLRWMHQQPESLMPGMYTTERSEEK